MILLNIGFHLDLQVGWNSALELGARVTPTDGAKLMMLDRQSECSSSLGSSTANFDPKKTMAEELEERGHRCGACHRASDAKVNLAWSKK